MLIDGVVLKSVTTDARVSFKWFRDLKIESIWDDFNEKGDMVKVAVLDTLIVPVTSNVAEGFV